MRAAEKFQLAVVECLRAEAGPIYSQGTEIAKFLRGQLCGVRCRDRSGINLERQFCAGHDFKASIKAPQDAIDLPGREQGWRAAAKINCIDCLGLANF